MQAETAQIDTRPDLTRPSETGVSILTTIISIGAIQILATLALVVRGKFVAVTLGPAGVGITSVIDQWVQSVAYFSAVSLPLVSTRFLSRAYSEGPDAFRCVYLMFLKVLLIVSLGGSLSAAAIAWCAPGLFGSAIAMYRVPLMLGLFSLPGLILNGYFSNVLASAGKPKASALLVLMANVVVGIAVCVGLRVSGIVGIYFWSLISGILVLIISLTFIRHTVKVPLFGRTEPLLARLKQEREVAVYTGLQFASTCVSSLALVVVRNCVLSEHGAAASGILQAQLAIAQAIFLVLNPPTFAVLMPIVNQRSSSDDKIRATHRYLKQFLGILILSAGALVTFPQLAIAILFSPRFLPAVDVLFIFVLATSLMLMVGIYQTLLIGLNDLHGGLTATMIGQAIVCCVAPMLIPVWGTTGAGISLLVGNSVSLGLCLIRLRRRFAMKVPAYLVQTAVGGLLLVGLTGWAWGREPHLSYMSIAVRSIILAAAGIRLWHVLYRSRHLAIG